MTRLTVLQSMRIGTGVAEDEQEKLSNYFIETDTWKRLYEGEIDVVYGSKGSGKSALYVLLIKKAEDLKSEQKISVVAGENIEGTPVFASIEPSDISEENFRRIWKVFLLVLICKTLQESNFSHPDLNPILKKLEEEQLLPVFGLNAVLKKVMNFLGRIEPKFKFATPDGASYEAEGKLGEIKATENYKNEFEFVDEFLDKINAFLVQNKDKIWVLLDRLDVAFTDPQKESPAMRALFRVYMDFSTYSQIKLKIFFRQDIWDRITKNDGFRERSHIVRTADLEWNPEQLRYLILSRIFNNSSVVEITGIDKKDALSSADKQLEAWSKVFPKQVEAGKRQSSTFDWILSHTQDGKQKPGPREIIELLESSRQEQIKLDQTGNKNDSEGVLITSTAIKRALAKVSAKKITTIYSEYPGLRKYVEMFKKGKAEHSIGSIKELLEELGHEKDSRIVVENLVEVGFLQEKNKGSGRENTTYWIPFIFRNALEITQGSAFKKK